MCVSRSYGYHRSHNGDVMNYYCPICDTEKNKDKPPVFCDLCGNSLFFSPTDLAKDAKILAWQSEPDIIPNYLDDQE